MGTRLYPQTKSSKNLETLAGVPTGTMARLEAIKAQFAHDAYSEAAYDAIYGSTADANLGNLDNFLLNGWGKTVCNTLDRMGFDGVGGSCDDFEQCVEILRMHHNNQYNPLSERELRLLALASEGLSWG